MIEYRDVSFAYPGASSRPALSGVDITIGAGESVVVVGRNGSGKSTLAQLANGLLLPLSGRVEVDGIPTGAADTIWDLRSKVGLVFQNPDNQIVGTMVEEDVAFGPENMGLPRDEIRRRVDDALRQVGLTGLESREPHQLSGGQKQRLAIAGALALQPAYLVLDEPTSMLDPTGRQDVLTVLAELRQRGVGVLHITHHLEDAAAADRVVALDAGRVAFNGSPDDLFSDEERLSDLGIRLPALAQLASRLRQHGVSIPSGPLDVEGVVNSLWP